MLHRLAECTCVVAPCFFGKRIIGPAAELPAEKIHRLDPALHCANHRTTTTAAKQGIV